MFYYLTTSTIGGSTVDKFTTFYRTLNPACYDGVPGDGDYFWASSVVNATQSSSFGQNGNIFFAEQEFGSTLNYTTSIFYNGGNFYCIGSQSQACPLQIILTAKTKWATTFDRTTANGSTREVDKVTETFAEAKYTSGFTYWQNMHEVVEPTTFECLSVSYTNTSQSASFSGPTGPIGKIAITGQFPTTSYKTVSRKLLRLGLATEISNEFISIRPFETTTHTNWSSTTTYVVNETDTIKTSTALTVATTMSSPYVYLFAPAAIAFSSAKVTYMPGLPPEGYNGSLGGAAWGVAWGRQGPAVFWMPNSRGMYSSHKAFPASAKPNLTSYAFSCASIDTKKGGGKTIYEGTTQQTNLPFYSGFAETYSTTEEKTSCDKTYSTQKTISQPSPALTYSVAAERAAWGKTGSDELGTYFSSVGVFSIPNEVDQAGSGTLVSVKPSFVKISFFPVNAAGENHPFIHADARPFTVSAITSKSKFRSGLGATSQSYTTSTKRTFSSFWASSSTRAWGGTQSFRWKPMFPNQAYRPDFNQKGNTSYDFATILLSGSYTTGAVGAAAGFYPQAGGPPQGMQPQEESYAAIHEVGTAILGPLFGRDRDYEKVSVTVSNSYYPRGETARSTYSGTKEIPATTSLATMSIVAEWDQSKIAVKSNTTNFVAQTYVLSPEDRFSAFLGITAFSADQTIRSQAPPIGIHGNVRYDAPNLSIADLPFSVGWPTYGSTTKTTGFDEKGKPTTTYSANFDWSHWHQQ